MKLKKERVRDENEKEKIDSTTPHNLIHLFYAFAELITRIGDSNEIFFSETGCCYQRQPYSNFTYFNNKKYGMNFTILL